MLSFLTTASDSPGTSHFCMNGIASPLTASADG